MCLLAVKSENLSSIPGTHMMKMKNWHLEVALWYPCAQYGMLTPTQYNTEKQIKLNAKQMMFQNIKQTRILNILILKYIKQP